MTLLAISKTQEAGGQIALAVVLGVIGLFLLLPRPRGRLVAGGIASLLAAAAVFGVWVYRTFGHPLPDVVGSVLFWFFAAGALGFGAVLVAQRNPARGAIAFAFVILSTCGLFLLLAAPFLMAATIIIYAGAIIVTFLFVLMLSHAEGPSDENDRSREPLYGSFAGFAFVGLVLFTLYQTSQTNATAQPGMLPAPVITTEERKELADIITRLDAADANLDGDLSTATARNQQVEYFETIRNDLVAIVGPTTGGPSGSLWERLEKAPAHDGKPGAFYRADPQAQEALARAKRVREANFKTSDLEQALPALPARTDTAAIKAQVKRLREEVVILRGMGELPADNVHNLGWVLYSEHLLAIELAGTLLLVAVIGAIAIAQRKRNEVPGEFVESSPAHKNLTAESVISYPEQVQKEGAK